MTKSFQPEQVNLKLSLITVEDAMSGRLQANEENKNKKGQNNDNLLEGSANNKNSQPANRLLVLFYQGTDNLTKIL